MARYPLDEAEKRLLQRAIRSARRARPYLPVIDEADAMLREITREREPVDEESFQTEMRRLARREESNIAQIGRYFSDVPLWAYLVPILLGIGGQTYFVLSTEKKMASLQEKQMRCITYGECGDNNASGKAGRPFRY
jgi:hypothetical protein